ncbi:MAG: glycosyltransferase family 39 protein [Tannerellaceae bacterium]|jgi:4-amino-4-deoxy-L-arabinose transferase-like glycosyltransferase|nr:glycosyltransferase family 39 protein [Tannerellaceae bacterium]
MRTPSLQYLYLQKPVTIVIIIAAIAVLPFIGLGSFSTKGEPREASVAVSMLQTGNWILPHAYADEFAYKPPLYHWLVAIFSLPQGYVSEFTARLPSALAYILLAGFTLLFFGERTKFQEAFIAVLLLITCFEIHRAGLAARVDMLSSMLTVLSLYALYRWEEHRELKGIPLSISILLGCSILSKGPVGVVLPLFAFGVYLLIMKKYSLLILCKTLLYVGISSLFIPLLWYVAAWKQGGDNFMSIMLAENFGRFLHIDNPALAYDLGHRNGVWYHPVMLLAGFIPWTLLALFSLGGIRYRMPQGRIPDLVRNAWAQIRSLEKVKLFSLVAAVCILIFYSIPTSKRSVYLMPAYPFVALLLADYLLRIASCRKVLYRIFAGFLACIAFIFYIVIGAAMSGRLDIFGFAQKYCSLNASSQNEIAALSQGLATPGCLALVILFTGLAALISVLYHICKKNNLKLLYAAIALTLAINFAIDGIIMRSIQNGVSAKSFADQITQHYPLNDTNTFVVNDLREYGNLYGLNFYMKNILRNFETAQPYDGYFLVAERDANKVTTRYAADYTFSPLASSTWISDAKGRIFLYRFEKK